MTLRITNWIIIAMLALSVLAIAPAVYAHGDAEDEGGHHAEKAELSMEQMEQMVVLLQKVVVLLVQYRTQYGSYVVPTTAYVAPVTHHEEATEEEHHEHEEATATSPAATLVIEVEPHNGKTHAHVRYTDKPEEMFFVDPVIGDEDGVVAAISAKTGLGADVVRAALKYMQ